MKKLIAFVLASLMISAIIPISVSAVTDTAYDVNGDGKVNVFDCMIVKGIYFGSANVADDVAARADVNGDGKVNVFDYITVKQVYFAESDKTPVDNARDIDFTAHKLSGGIDGMEQGLPCVYGLELEAILVSDFDGLNALLEDCIDYGNSGDDTYLSDFAGELSEDYFDENALVITPVCASSGSMEIEIESITVDESGILVRISINLYGEGTDDEQCRLMTAEVKKSDIGDCATASAVICDCGIDYTYDIFVGGNPLTNEGDLVTKLITDHEQLAELAANCDPLAIDGFVEYAEALPEDYFDTKALILTGITGPTIGESFEVANVARGDEAITVTIFRWLMPNTPYPDAFLEAIVVSEVKKSDIGDVTNVVSEYRN